MIKKKGTGVRGTGMRTVPTTKEMKPILALIVPCYNEEQVLPITEKMFLGKLKELIQRGLIDEKSRILCVDDGSRDQTWAVIRQFARMDEHCTGISQSRNRGHQSAVLAGMMEAKEWCDIAITIDCDGQDDINAVDEMIQKYQEGCDIVYGVRSSRETDHFLKRFTAESFYRFMNWMGCEIVFNHADYRLVSSRVLKEFENYREVNLFLRGMFPLIGFESGEVYYKRMEREAGKSHYSIGKMFGLAVDGITSLSVRPIRLITVLGIFVSFLSFLGVIWAVASRLFGKTVTGWTSIICVVCFLSGIQLISLGVIGEYVGKTYMEAKARPRYILKDQVGDFPVGRKQGEGEKNCEGNEGLD